MVRRYAADHGAAELAQSGVGGLETAVAETAARIVGELHDAQAAGLEDVEKIELILDRIGTLEMEDDSG